MTVANQEQCNNSKYALFIGRWQPIHIGHEYIIRKKLDEGENVAIAVRDIPVSKSDPFPMDIRIKIIEAVFSEDVKSGRVKVFPIVDISSVNIGRGVGYDVNDIEVPAHIELVSATEIRKRIIEGGTWRQYIPQTVIKIIEENKVYLTLKL